jgi:hypothetical protein
MNRTSELPCTHRLINRFVPAEGLGGRSRSECGSGAAAPTYREMQLPVALQAHACMICSVGANPCPGQSLSAYLVDLPLVA